MNTVTIITKSGKHHRVTVMGAGAFLYENGRAFVAMNKINPNWRIAETGAMARDYFAPEIQKYQEQRIRSRQQSIEDQKRAEEKRIADQKEAQLARRRELARRTPEEKLADKMARLNRRSEKVRQMEARKDAEAAEQQAYSNKRACYLSSQELLDSGQGWTRHYITKLLGKADWIESYTTRGYDGRQDVTRYLWERSRVEQALPILKSKTQSKSAV